MPLEQCDVGDIYGADDIKNAKKIGGTVLFDVYYSLPDLGLMATYIHMVKGTLI